MAVVDNAAGITIDATGQHNNAKLLDGLPAAVANGQAVRFQEAVLTDGSHPLTGPIPGIDPTAPSHLATRAYVDTTLLTVAAVTTAALPAYTVSGGSGVGSTLTANANGAFPVLDGNVSLIASAVESMPCRFLLHNGASAVDNGVYCLTQQGSGGAPWIAVRYTGMDSAGEIQGSIIRAAFGIQSNGALYEYRGIAAVVMGTTNLFWLRMDPHASPNERIILCDEDFVWGQVNSNVTSAVNPGGFAYSITGGTVTALVAGSQTATRMGVVSLNTGTTATGRASLLQAGGSIFLGINTGFFLEAKCALPVLSDGTNTFSAQIGLTDAITNPPTNAVALTFQPLISGTDWQVSTINAGTPTNTPSGRTIVAATDDRVWLSKYPGDANIYAQMNGGSLITIATNIPTANPVSVNMSILKSAGAVSRSFEVDYIKAVYFSPLRRAA